MKLNRQNLRKMILKEIKQISESQGYIRKQMPDGRIALYQRVPGGSMSSTKFVKFEGDMDPEDYETVEGVCPQTGQPFKMEVDVRQQYGREVAQGTPSRTICIGPDGQAQRACVAAGGQQGAARDASDTADAKRVYWPLRTSAGRQEGGCVSIICQ